MSQFEIPMEIKFDDAPAEATGKRRFSMKACSDKISTKRIRFNESGLATMAGSDPVPVVVRGHENGDGDLLSVIGFSDRRYVKDGWLIADGYLLDSSPEAAQIVASADEDSNYAKLAGGSICGKITNLDSVEQLEDEDGQYIQCSEWGHWRHLLMCPNYGAAIKDSSAEFHSESKLGIAATSGDWGEILVAASGQPVAGETQVIKPDDVVVNAFRTVINQTDNEDIKSALLATYQGAYGTPPDDLVVQASDDDSVGTEVEPVAEDKDLSLIEGAFAKMVDYFVADKEVAQTEDETPAEETDEVVDVAQSLSDEDVDRIATKLVEKLAPVSDATEDEPEEEVVEEEETPDAISDSSDAEVEEEVVEDDVEQSADETEIAQLRSDKEELERQLRVSTQNLSLRRSGQLEVAAGAAPEDKHVAQDNLGLRGFLPS